MRTHFFFAATAFVVLAACSPSDPAPARVPARDVDFTVTTMASTADRRFLVQFRSLTDRTLCISADDWPTSEGYLGANRPPDAGDEVHRVGPRDTLVAFVRFDQVPPASRQGDGARNVDFAPEPFFCTSAP
ncbi:MAG: hypothetical protein AB7H66_00255 [Hyphomonadaceae bacterium]